MRRGSQQVATECVAVIRVPLRVPLNGSIGIFHWGFRVLGVGAVIRGAISPLLWVVSIATLLITLLVTTLVWS